QFEAIPLWELTEGIEAVLDLREYIVDRNDPVKDLRIWTVAPGVRVEGTTLVALHTEWMEDHRIEVGASDGEDGTVVSIDVTVVNVNDPPVVDSVPPGKAFVDTKYVYDLQVIDEDPDDFMTFSIVSGPSDATIDEWGRLSWTPGEADVGTVTMNVSVDDGNVTVHQERELDVELENRPPSILNSPPDSAEAGVGYRWDIEARDPDGDILRFALVVGPTGASLDNVSGTLLWLPRLDFKDKVVTVAFTVRVSDGEFDVTLDFSVVLTYPPNRPPEILGELPEVVLSQGISIDLTEHMWDPDDPLSDLSWYIVGGDKGLVDTRMNGNVLILRPAGEGSGDVDLELVLEDDEGMYDSVMLHVEILASDDGVSPWVLALVVVVLCAAAALLHLQRRSRTDRRT
ncbi:MAG: hypothetical protein KAS77_03110, partial [Thermoplasmata archaeon]|nr:hypothetical protein [Thermoplasmata archaeon]